MPFTPRTPRPACCARPSRLRRLVAPITAAVALVLVAAGCATSAPHSDSPANASGTGATASSKGVLRVVVAEDFWGNIVSELGGESVKVTSIISGPNIDPHDYEATASDGREVAQADYVVYNGAGYDSWMTDLLASAGPRKVLDIASLVGVKNGENPHLWYSPDFVHQMAAQVASDLAELDPAKGPTFASNHTTFTQKTLAGYNAVIAAIRTDHKGAPIAATESIAAPLADALGLKLVTPAGFLDAISEGSEPSAKDKLTADRQISGKQVKVLIVNAQNMSPDVQQLVDKAKAAGVPRVSVTETLPAGDTFASWQTAQLTELRAILDRAQ